MVDSGTWTRAALWTISEKIGGLITQLLIFLLLARLLGPASFGVFSTVFVLFIAATTVCDAGFQVALVRRPKVEDGMYHSVFWAMVAGAVVYAVAVALATPWIARLFEHPEVVPVILSILPLLAIYPLVTIFTTHMKRGLQFRALAVRPLIANGLAGTIAVGAAFADAGVYSLVVREYLVIVIQIALAATVVAWRPRLHFRFAELVKVTRFARHGSAHGLMHMLGGRIPAPIIAGTIGIVPAGYFGAASRLGDLVFALARFTMGRVGLQAFSHGDPSIEEVRRMYRYALRLVALVTVPMFCGLSLVAEPLVATLLDDEWLPVSGLLAILSLGYLPLCFASLNRTLMFARGRARWVAWETAIGLVAAVAGVWLAVPYGLEAVGWAIAGRNLLVLAISTAGVLRYFDLPPALLASAVLRPALAAAAMVAAILALRHTGVADGDSLPGLAILVAGGAAAYGAAVLALMPREMVALAGRLRSALRPAAAG